MCNINTQNSNAMPYLPHPDLFKIIPYATTLHLNAFNVTGLPLSLVNTSPPLASVANVPAMIVAEVS